MRYIITESQHRMVTKQWLLRRIDKVIEQFNDTIELIDPCKYDEYDRYEYQVMSYMVDGLHHEYYLIPHFDIAGLENAVIEMFYDEMRDIYRNKKC